jgi:hypothetical protein
MSGEVVTCLKRHSESSLEPDGSLGAAYICPISGNLLDENEHVEKAKIFITMMRMIINIKMRAK